MRPVVLVILDGWGYSAENRGNAIAQAQKPTLDAIEQLFPFVLLQASGISVGLPWNEPGNSEVGHMNMGTGTIRYQPLTRINRSILDGSFFANPTLKKMADHVRSHKSALHLIGLFGSGSVHSYRDHLYALLEFSQREQLAPVFIHPFLDGRDSPPAQGAELLQELIARLSRTNEGHISTVVGRHFALDRDKQWDRTKRAYELLVNGTGAATNDPVASVRASYGQNVFDEFVEPLVCPQAPHERPGTIQNGDAVIFIDFREDSARQLAYAFLAPSLVKGFTPHTFENLLFVTMTRYSEDLKNDVILPPLEATNSVSALVAARNERQFKIAETEKYAHVTYFFNGGREAPFPGEDRILAESLKTSSYTTAPEMRAQEIGDKLAGAIEKNEYHLLVANFANADMVSHTGDFEATKRAVQAVDGALALVVRAAQAANAVLLLTADHGHAETMLDIRTGRTLTEHSANPVPLYVVAEEFRRPRSPQDQWRSRGTIAGILADIAATTLDFLEIPLPADIEGKSLRSLFGGL